MSDDWVDLDDEERAALHQEIAASITERRAGAPTEFGLNPGPGVAQMLRGGGQLTEYQKMQILINTDSNIEGREKLATHIRGVVEGALGRFRERITRVEVHLSDENGHKGGQDDKRCMMEARLEGRQPTVVTHHAATLNEAVKGAADKLERSIDSAIGRMQQER